MLRWPLFRRRSAIPPVLWAEALRRLPYAAALPATDQSRLHDLAVRFLRNKTFEGAAGLEVTDWMRVAIALQACLLILNLGENYYSGWRAVILYPGDFRVSKEVIDEDGIVHEWTEELAGESWERGPVILSWETSAVYDPDLNIVLHEFAHKLDMLDGAANGCPPLPATIPVAAWTRDFENAYAAFCGAVDRGEVLSMDDYAAESPAEFFAVLSERFFLQPEQVNMEFPELYRHLRSFYRQDPLAVLTPT
jgi:Mlc titration factor MtfA (ptsG expression regulator)